MPMWYCRIGLKFIRCDKSSIGKRVTILMEEQKGQKGSKENHAGLTCVWLWVYILVRSLHLITQVFKFDALIVKEINGGHWPSIGPCAIKGSM